MEVNQSLKGFNLYLVEKGFDLYNLDRIACPICGKTWHADLDDSEGAPFEDMEWECVKCGGEFLLDCEPTTSYFFTSRKHSEEVAE